MIRFYTRNDKFDCDNIFSAAFLKSVFKDCQINRVDEFPKGIDPNRGFDIEGGTYTFKCNQQKFYKYDSVFGMLWRKYGRLYLRQNKFDNIFKAGQLFYNRLVFKISYDACCEFENIKELPFTKVILSLSPTYIQETDQREVDFQYDKAVYMAKLYMDNLIRDIYEEVVMRKVETRIWKKAEKESKDGIYVLEDRIPWRNFLNESNQDKVKFIISKSNRGGYNVVSKDVNNIAIKNSEYLTYLHPSKFLGVAKDLDNAIKAAKYSLSQAI